MFPLGDRCSPRCYYAENDRCKCKCGGKYHGLGRVKQTQLTTYTVKEATERPEKGEVDER